MNRRGAKTQRRKIQRLFCLRVLATMRLTTIMLAIATASCSLPNLEDANCSEARNVVKQFYSVHFGNDMRPSAENLKARERFLTNELTGSLSASNETAKDYFTATENYPRAFRVGTCASESNDKAILQVVLLWRDDTKSDQKEVKVEAVKDNGKWLINKVFN